MTVLDRTWRASLLALVLVAPAQALGAQGAKRATNWAVRFDQSGVPDAAVDMGDMPPGWHVTARADAPGAVAFDATLSGDRTFTLESEQIFFTGAAGAGNGVVIAGRGLDTPTPRFVAFTIFPDGRYSVTRHAGARRDVLVAPVAHAAIAKHPGGNAQVKNVLLLEGTATTVTLKVNGTVVTQLPRAVVDPGGTVGLRIEPGANLHITTFVLDGKNRAPVAAR